MIFDFFTESLPHERSYDYPPAQVESLNQWIESLAAKHPKCKVHFPKRGPTGNWDVASTTVKHCFCDSSYDNMWLPQVQKMVGTSLPEDFVAFYNIWHEGILMTRNPVRMLSIEELVLETQEIRRNSGVVDNIPFHVLRFGEINSQRHFALRLLSDEQTWVIDINSWNEVTDAELISPDWDNSFTDLSFGQWLRRMISTDGAPLDPDSPDEDDFYVKRIV